MLSLVSLVCATSMPAVSRPGEHPRPLSSSSLADASVAAGSIAASRVPSTPVGRSTHSLWSVASNPRSENPDLCPKSSTPFAHLLYPHHLYSPPRSDYPHLAVLHPSFVPSQFVAIATTREENQRSQKRTSGRGARKRSPISLGSQQPCPICSLPKEAVSSHQWTTLYGLLSDGLDPPRLLTPPPQSWKATNERLSLPPIVLGGGVFGYDYNTADDLESDIPEQTLRLAFRYGITTIDTSPYYTTSEAVLGRAFEAVADEFPRSTYQIITKAGRYGRTREDGFDYSPERIRRSISRSLALMKTDYLDGGTQEAWQEVVVMNDLRSVHARCRVRGRTRGRRCRGRNHGRGEWGGARGGSGEMGACVWRRGDCSRTWRSENPGRHGDAVRAEEGGRDSSSWLQWFVPSFSSLLREC